ncbi:MAG: hypothetical protein ACYS22_16295 [Planctomycetota bacterium]
MFYGATAHLEVLDREGKVLATLSVSDVGTRTDEKKARNPTHHRIARFASAEVLASAPVQQRLTEKARAAAQVFIDKVNRERRTEEQGGEAEDDE